MDAKTDKQLAGKQGRRSKGQKTSSDPQPKVDAQPFDNIVKALFGLDGAQIVPELLADVQVMDA
ncbi:MAG TPA: hypothetical protein VN207_06995 [Ktedonobacteraceae bacterium]|nr:hypothetical protein [Ktedonobacteraceae bacterium]